MRAFEAEGVWNQERGLDIAMCAALAFRLYVEPIESHPKSDRPRIQRFRETVEAAMFADGVTDENGDAVALFFMARFGRAHLVAVLERRGLDGLVRDVLASLPVAS